MSSKVLSDAERDSLNLILEDLRYLFSKEEILQDEIEGVLESLKSDEVKSYIQSLRYGSKPETALRESFIAGKSILLKFLFGEAIPEVRSNGFIDYLIKDEMGRGIALELKPLFETIVKPDKSGKPILEKIKQWRLRPEDYKEQILKYIREGEAQFVILTDLRDWYFYSRELTPRELKHFCSISLFEFIKEYEVVGNLRDYLERKELESIRYELDKWFLESLKAWVNSLSAVGFTVDERRKLELIIGLINKFIFVQTLDDYGVIEFNWIKKRWAHHEQMWQRKGKRIVLEKFFDELDDWFYLYYDTELFKEKILPYIKQNDENIDKLYRNLQLILGLTYLQVPFGALKGIMQYNFRYIDEDILGKAYETFLTEIRREEGVYYTPKYITQYIAENTIGKVFDELLAEIRKELMKDGFEETAKLASKFASIKVLDPACGSGSFLIKAIRIIVGKYRELNQLVEDAEKTCIKKNSNNLSSLSPSREIKTKLELISLIKRAIGPKNDRELISRILIRHIYGNDLDKRALEVAKVNIWLEAIKLSPKEFRYDRLPANTNYILPNLEANLCNGNSVIGLPEDFVIEFLHQKHRDILVELSRLRGEYLENPMNPQLVEEMEESKRKLREEMDDEFVGFLKSKGLSLQIIDKTKPFHWPLEMWYSFFDENGSPLPEKNQGFDIVIGNPPYVSTREMSKAGMDKEKEYFRYTYSTAKKGFDLYVVFVHKGFKLLKNQGRFGFIIPNKFMIDDYGLELRNLLINQTMLQEIVDVSTENVFPEASVYPHLIFFVRTDSPPAEYNLDILYGLQSSSGRRKIPITLFRQMPESVFVVHFTDIEFSIIERMLKVGTPFKDVCRLHSGTTGFEAANMAKCLIDGIHEDAEEKIHFIVTGNIDRYSIKLGNVRYQKRTFENPFLVIDRAKISEGKIELFTKPKIVIGGMTTTIEAAYDSKGLGLGVNVFAVTDFETDPYYILALLNSALFSFYYSIINRAKHLAGGFLAINKGQLENLAIF